LDPLEYIALATELHHALEPDGDRQVILRTVVNRSYLGALMATAAFLENVKGRNYPRDRGFYGAVEGDLVDELPGFNDRLATLRRYRADADYDLGTDIPRAKAEHALRVAISYTADLRSQFG